jgi:hypothetical protein
LSSALKRSSVEKSTTPRSARIRPLRGRATTKFPVAPAFGEPFEEFFREVSRAQIPGGVGLVTFG